MSHKTFAVLIDPGCVPAFDGLLDDFSLPMLPVGTKPLIHFWLDAIAQENIGDVLILVDHFPEQIREYIAAGHWDLNVYINNIRHGQAFKTQKVMVDKLQADSILIASMNGFPQFEDISTDLHKAGVVTFKGLDGFAKKYAESSNMALAVLEHAVMFVRSPTEYWRLNMDLLSGEVQDPRPSGFEAAKGVVIGGQCSIGKEVRYFSPLILGSNSVVGRGSIIGANAVIGEHCVLGEGCYVRDSVVIGRSYVGNQVSLERVVVSGNKAFRVDDGELMRVDDLETLAKVGGAKPVSNSERLVAMCLLLMLIIPACVFVLWHFVRGKNILKSEVLYLDAGFDAEGERRYEPLSVLSLAVANKAWKKVLWLWYVVTKKIKLVGTSPRKSANFVYPMWVDGEEVFVPGVINQADFNNIEEGDAESVVVADAFQLAKSEIGLCWSMLRKWLTNLCIK